MYVSRLPLSMTAFTTKHWEGMDESDEQSRDFIRRLRIPIHNSNPSLLLHGLGHSEQLMPDMMTRIEQIFDGQPRLVVRSHVSYPCTHYATIG